MKFIFFFFQAEDGIRDLVRSRGLGDVYKRQMECVECARADGSPRDSDDEIFVANGPGRGHIQVLSLIHI